MNADFKANSGSSYEKKVENYADNKIDWVNITLNLIPFAKNGDGSCSTKYYM